MADNSDLLKFLQQVGVLNAADSDAAKQLLAGETERIAALDKEMGVISVSSEEAKKIFDGTAEGAKGLGAAAEGAGKGLQMTRRELRGVADEFGRAAGVEDASKRFLNGPGIAAYAAAKALEALAHSIQNVRQGGTDPIDIEVKDDTAAIITAAKAWDQYATARQKVIDANNTPQAQAGREAQGVENNLTRQKQVIAAEEQNALAALATKRGEMSPQAYALAADQIKAAFDEKLTKTDEQNEQDKIKIKEKTAAALDAKAAKEKAQGESMSTGNASAQEAAKANAQTAVGEVKTTQERIDLINRLDSKETTEEYTGIFGPLNLASDYADYLWNHGLENRKSALNDETLKNAQAKAKIALGIRAGEQQDRLAAKKAQLLATAGVDSGQAENLRQNVQQDQAEANAQLQTDQGLAALEAVNTALGYESTAEKSHTWQGHKDAIASLNAGNAAAAQVQTAIKAVGDSNKELHDALFVALAEISAENKKLAGMVKQQSFNNH